MENKTNFKITMLFAATSFLFSCGNLDNPKERNKITFKDSVNTVADSINAMNKILIKSREGIYTYGIDVDMNNIDRNEKEFFLYVDDSSHILQMVGLITDTLLYKSKLLNFIDAKERKHFVSLALYLSENYLSSCKIENGQLFYMYRFDIFMADAQKDLVRYIVFASSEHAIDLRRYKILDNRNNLYLLADKDAKIWSSE